MFFFNDTATTEIYTLSLHDALPISSGAARALGLRAEPGLLELKLRGAPRRRAEPVYARVPPRPARALSRAGRSIRSEEHTSELQSRQYLVCRLLLEKKKTYTLTSRH